MAAPALSQAESIGLVSYAFPTDTLEPEKAITRQEVAAILDYARVVKFLLNEETNNEDQLNIAKDLMKKKELGEFQNTPMYFSDMDTINPRFKTSVEHLVRDGLLSGYDDGSIRPENTLTRAEAMTILIAANGETPQVLENPQVHIEDRQEGTVLINSTTGEPLRRSQFKGGLVKSQGGTYLIDINGNLTSNYYEDGEKTYYIDGKNGMARGWKQVGEKLHYFSPMDNRMYKDGIFSTGEGAYWFDEDGVVREGNRPGGQHGRLRYWAYPKQEELSNKWLEGEDVDIKVRGQEIANFSAAHEGLPFKWYGTDLTDGTGVYCVGNTYSAYKAFGIKIPGPEDCNIKLHKGYELTRVQYEYAESFGGTRYPADFSIAWPGDLVFNYSPNFYLGYNHVGIFMGMNGDKPIYSHCALANGLIAEDCRIMNKELNRQFNKEFIRYNTRQNIDNLSTNNNS